VPAEGKFSFANDPDSFSPFNMAHSDDYLFLSNSETRLRAYAFAADGGLPERVCEFKELTAPRGMAFHRTTGTLLTACADDRSDGSKAGIELLDTRPRSGVSALLTVCPPSGRMRCLSP
jgi:hypothetical protein